jgi:hypothetical protein
MLSKIEHPTVRKLLVQNDNTLPFSNTSLSTDKTTNHSSKAGETISSIELDIKGIYSSINTLKDHIGRLTAKDVSYTINNSQQAKYMQSNLTAALMKRPFSMIFFSNLIQCANWSRLS